MNPQEFGHKIQKVRQRTKMLEESVRELPEQQNDLHAQAFEELSTALEELHVAEEELRAQNEQLIIAHQQIEKERQRYQELFDLAPDGYIVTDADGKILEANSSASTLLNISKKYLIGKLFINFIPEEERRAFRSQLVQLCDQERMQEWEINIQSRQDGRFYASLSVSSIRDNEGKIIGWRWLIRDITERKLAEEKLRSIQLENLQLQEAARIKSEFLAVISHELRTPMNSILGFSQLLLRRYYYMLPLELRDMVERIIKSGQHLLKLIEEILDYCKLETEKLRLQPQQLNLVELVTETIEQMRPLAEQKNLTLVLHSNIEDPIIINDSTRLQQVLINLLSNAIKFTETGGVFIEVQQLNQDKVALMVKDTGIGISESDIKYIFIEFWQADKSTTRKYGGVGLGLAIVDKLVRLMNGTITVDSIHGKGSTFRVELPREMSV